MVKLVGALVIVAASGVAGQVVARGYARRPLELDFLQSALQMLETEIAYGATPLPEALVRIAGHQPAPVGPFLCRVAELLRGGEGRTAGEAWLQALGEHYQRMALNAGDREILAAFGANLGASDRNDQIKHLRLAVTRLGVAAEAARRDGTVNARLWQYLGVLGGTALALILY